MKPGTGIKPVVRPWQPARPPVRAAQRPAAHRSGPPPAGSGIDTTCRREWRSVIVGVLNHALALEIVRIQRSVRQHFISDGTIGLGMTQKFLEHATEDASHADRLAQRIGELGGQADLRPPASQEQERLPRHAQPDLRGLMRSDLDAEVDAIERYRQLIEFVGAKDPSTRQMLEQILAEKQLHADELGRWLMH